MLSEIQRLQTEPISPKDIQAVIAQYLTSTIWDRRRTRRKRVSWRSMN